MAELFKLSADWGKISFHDRIIIYGIPQKNIRLLTGKPLIAYAIQNALSASGIDDVFVSTDSEEIAEVARAFGAEILMRDAALSDDYTTLDPVIYDALEKAENIQT